MKKQFLTFFTVLLALTNWLHTANAQPTTTITPPSGTQIGVFDVTVTFSEAVTGFDQTELSVTGTANATITAWTAGGKDYVATITPTKDGDVVFNVAENVAEAGANNGNTAAKERTVQVLIPETVWMPDEYLRRFVKQKMPPIPIPYDTPLTQATLSSLTVLNQERSSAHLDPKDNLQNLTGLEYAINLSTLILHKNSISDLTPLQNLNNLSVFESTRSSISDLTPLRNLTNLTRLDLNANRIIDISVLQNLTGLRELDLGGNSIITITSLQNLTNLNKLIFSNNFISDITPLQNLINLTRLDLESNEIEDVAPLARLTNLKELLLYANPFRSHFPMVEIEVPEEIQTGAFDVTVRFNEDVTGFEQADLLVSGAAATITEWAEVTAEREYTATITPTEEGTVTLTIKKGVAEGKRKQALRTLKVSKPSMKIHLGSGRAGATSTELQDPNRAATPKDVEVDITRPSVDITVPTTPQAGVFNVTVVFAEPVTDFMQSELTVTGAGASITDWTPVDGGSEYTAEITPTAEGTVTLSVAENVVQDAAGNQNTASPSRTVEIDMTPPSVTITGVPTGVQNSAFDVTVTFSEDVTGFTASDIALTNSGGTDTVVATATVTGSGKTYTATITPTGEGTLGIQVPADAAVDAASNGNTASAKSTVTVDTVRPTVTITGVPATTQNTAFTVTITFSATVTGFTDSDIALSNSGVTTDTASATATVTGTGTTYTATLTPSGEGTLTIQVPADAAFNSENKGNVASAVHTVAIEAVPPTVTITGVPTTPQNSEFDVAITFSEDVTGFTASDIAFTNSGGTDTAAATATLKDDSDDNDATYAATITPTGTGSLKIQVPADAADDTVGNGNTASDTHTVDVDTVAPTVTITGVPGTIQNSAFDVTITFSEAVTGFTASDITFSGTGTADATATLSGTGTTYTVTITPTGNGVLRFQVPENVAVDAANNDNTASTVRGTNLTPAQQAITIDITRPSVTITGIPDTIQNSAFDVTITFSEDVTGFVASDIAFTNSGGVGDTAAAAATLKADSDDNDATYAATITPTGTGSLKIQVPANAAVNAANNGNTASRTHTVAVDADPPTVTITGVPTTPQNSAFDVTITFSEDVTGFAAADIAFTNSGGVGDTAAATATLKADSDDNDATYAATITPTGEGTLGIQVPADAAVDAASNGNTASAKSTVTVDTVAPTVTITGVPGTIQNSAFDVTITFSETVTGFTASDITFSGTGTADATATLSGTGTTYTVTITPTGNGVLRFQVPENVAVDAANNDNTASTARSTNLTPAQQTITIDITRPSVTITGIPSTTQNSAFDVTITFSEDVTGFVAADIAFAKSTDTGDTAAAAATLKADSDDNDATYTATITPTGTGSLKIQVPANAAVNAANNGNTASSTHTVAVDTVAPTVTITDVPDTIQNSAFSITLTFSETVTGFTASDIALTSTDTADATATVTGSGTTYTTTITPTGDGVLGIQVLENVAVDARGNLNTTSNTAQVQVDAVRPTVTITDVPTTTQNSVFAVTVTFSEAVTGFTADDIAFSTTDTGTATATVTGSGTTYTTTITPTGAGVLGIQVPENVAVDAGGNLNTASNTAQVQVDTTPPSVSIRVPEDVQDDAFEITVLFSEPVTGFSQAELAVTGVSATITNWAPQPDRARYIAQITPAEDIDGIVTFTIAENVAEDDAGNPNTVAPQQTVQVDSFIPPTIFGVEVTIQHTNPDSDPDINDLDSDGNHVDGPLVGAPMGNITATAYTPYRTSPVTDKVRFEVRRKDGTEWMAVETIDMESAVIVAQALPASVVQKWVATVAEGTPTVSIPDRYRKWMLEMDTTTLDDTITKDDAAGGRDVRIDENPYIIRAVAIAGGADHMGSGRVHDSFSVDNVDDVAPLERTIIFTVSDHGGMLTASNAGVFTVGGIVDEAILAPMVMLTAKPRAHVKTFDHIKLVVNVRNANGTLGDTVDVGEVVFEHLEGYSYTVTLDVSDLANAEYGFQGLAVDKAMNVEKKIDSVATSTDVENYTPPPDSVTTMDWTDDTEKDVATITEAYPRGYLVTKLFTFTLVAAGIHPPEIDVMLGGSSTRDAGLLTVEQTNDGGGGLADPRTFVVTLDTSSTPDGKYMLTGVITKRNGSSDFGLPMLNIDSTGPMVEMISPKYGHELSPLPTIRVTFTDGIGSGVVASSNTIMLELVRLMSGGESVDIPINQDEVDKPDGYIVEDNPNTPMVEASTGDLVYTSPDVLPGGAYELTVKVTDILGNTTNMGRGVTVDFTIVGTLLAVSIQSPISGQILDYKDPEIIVVYSGVGTEVTSFTLSNAADEAVAVNDPVMVSDPAQLDNNKMSYMPTEPLADGKYTAVVAVGDANGEVAKDAVTFTVSADDTTPAVITQVSPQGVVKSDSATLSVQAYDEQSGVATVTLSLNGGDAAEGETLAVTGLVSGTQTVDAVVTNGAGLETTFRWTFTVVLDTTPPEISSVTPQGLVQTADVMLSAVVVDDQSAITSVTIAVDGGDATPVAEADIQAGTISQAVTGLESGTHSATIVATSDGGSTSHVWTFTVMLDTTAPEISAVAPQGVVREANVMLSAVVVDDQSAITSVTIAVDGGDATPVAEADIQAGTISQAVTGLESGTHTAEIVATSDGGSTTHSWTFTVMLDTTAPEISAVAPQGIVAQETTLISAVVVDEQSPVTSVTIAIDGGEPVDVPEADIQSGNISMELGDLKSGTYAVEIVATSRGGSRTHSWTFTVRLDTTPPEISSVAPQGLIRDDAVSISAVVVDEQSALESVTIALDDGAPIAVATVDIQNGRVGRDVLGLTTGTHTVTITATSAGGTTAHAWTFTVELDEKPPTITSTGPHGLVRKERPVVSVVATDDLSGVDTIEITLADSSGKKVTGETAQDRTSATFIPENAFTDDTQGTYVAKATVKDVRGNEASVQWAFTVEFDTIPPVITTATPQGEARITERKPLISAAYTDDASGIDTKSVKLWVDGKPVTPTKVTTSQVTYLPIADLNYGRRTVKLEVSDLATRKPNKTTHEWSFYVEAKTTRIVDARPIPNPFKDSTTITFTLSRQSRVTVELYDMSSRLVRTLVRGRMYDVGDASKIVWDGKTDTGEDLARGVYFCRIVLDSELTPESKVLKLALTR